MYYIYLKNETYISEDIKFSYYDFYAKKKLSDIFT